MARIAVLMSGGIDSSAAALMLKQAGHDVMGLTARMWSGASKCCGDDDIYSAQRVCHNLGIPHRVIDLTRDFRDHVVAGFVGSYLEGLTPNPCAACNRDIKFGKMFDAALGFGFDRVASGHYASLAEIGGRVVLAEPRDKRKSQVYFLSLVRPEVLPRLEFPLGVSYKRDVIEMVRSQGLPARKSESQDLCFVTSGRYDEVLRAHCADPGEGDVLDADGRVVARHKGHYAYTVGQRFGLRGKRYYVTRKCAAANQITVGGRERAMARAITARSVNHFLNVDAGPASVVFVKYRYNSAAVRGRLTKLPGGRIRVLLDEPCFAPAPGQIVACYQGEHLVCGGIIEEQPDWGGK